MIEKERMKKPSLEYIKRASRYKLVIWNDMEEETKGFHNHPIRTISETTYVPNKKVYRDPVIHLLSIASSLSRATTEHFRLRWSFSKTPSSTRLRGEEEES